ncbi:MAG: phosphatase [Spirochaetales bacterium]|nr:MAG: phosphatase [Spirochaetales bacterium]
MKLLIDPHCHTLASGHSFSTVMENAAQAGKKRLRMMGITDHAPGLPGSAHIFYTKNMHHIPQFISGVEMLRGIEANITDIDGRLDVEMDVLEKLDLVLAGFHEVVIKPTSSGDHTRALLSVMENPWIDVLVHLGNPNFPFDCEKVLAAAKEKKVLIEINNSSLYLSRKGSTENCRLIAELCRDMEVPLIVGSDAHIALDVGNFSKALQLLKDARVPEKLVMNTDVGRFKDFLKGKGKKRFL